MEVGGPSILFDLEANIDSPFVRLRVDRRCICVAGGRAEADGGGVHDTKDSSEVAGVSIGV